jgi:hypothetical protein
MTSSAPQPGFVSGDAFYPRSQILTTAARAASGFASMGVGGGDAVAFLMRNDVPILELTIGAGLLGAVTVPINWHFKGAEVEYILKDSGASVLVVHSDLVGPIRDAIPASVQVIVVDTPEHIGRAYGVVDDRRCASTGDVRWLDWIGAHEPWDGPAKDAPTTLIYTSGTTGRPKGVRRQALTPEQRAAFASVARQTLGLTEGSRTIITAPMYHSAPNATAMFALQSGATAVTFRRRGPPSANRSSRDNRGPIGSDDVRATVEFACGDTSSIRPEHAGARSTHGSTVPSGCQASDDPVVGTGDLRILRIHRDRRRDVLLQRGMARAPGHGRAPGRRRHGQDS